MSQAVETELSSQQQAILATYKMGTLTINLQDHPAIAKANPHQYRGCGSGWIEIDQDGKVVKLRYGHSIDWPGDQDSNMISAHINQRNGFRVAGKNLRLHANFSCWLACGF